MQHLLWQTLAYGSQKNTDDIIAAGVVPLLVALLRSDQPAVQEHAALALTSLADGSQHIQDAINAAGSAPFAH